MAMEHEFARLPGLGLLCCFALCFAFGLGLVSAEIASAQVPLPHSETGIVLDDLTDVEVLTFDAGTLPARAHVEVNVSRPPSHPALELEVRMVCPISCVLSPSFDQTRTLSPSIDTVEFSLAESCAPSTPLPGVNCDIETRATDFGTGGGPASVDLDVVGLTVVPFYRETVEYDPVPQQTSLVFGADRDTTLYQQNGNWNNGLGNSVWAGSHYVGSPPFGSAYLLHGMMTFDINTPLVPTPGTIPFGSTIDDAVLSLRVLENRGPLSSVTISAVTDIDNNPFTFDDWNSGTANAPDPEIEGLLSLSQGATWDARDFPSGLWNMPGAGTGPVLTSTLIPVFGNSYVNFSSLALTDEIRHMWTTARDGMGFQLRASSINRFLLADQAVRFASRDHPIAAYRPELQIFYTPEFADPYEDSALRTGTVSFIGEGENFRWIYDEDEDDILITNIGGRCEETQFDEGQGLYTVPYNYTFQGDPNYVGLDCCTWQIESQATGTVGTGQALFFLNVDASDPANFPPDTDSDGIADLCDNCPYTPNGPLMGSCVGGPDSGQLCRSDQECGAPSFCSLSQQDDDFELPGQACPEPGMGLMLMVGTMSLAARNGKKGSK